MSYKIVPDISGMVAQWVCLGLKTDTLWIGPNLTFGFFLNGELIGGLIFNEYRPNHDVWWTIYSTNKRWCNRRMLRQMFDLAFNKLKCRRINLLIDTDNANSLNLVQKLGFKQEGLLRQFRENGADCFIYSMLKNECKWIKNKGEI